MADLPTGFWSGYIIVITVVSFIALVAFVANVYFSEADDSELESQVWDHDLKEGTSPAPIWWFWMIFALMIVSVVYLMLYPGLGSFSGVLKWSQGGEIAASREAFIADFGERRAGIADSDAVMLSRDADMVDAGERIFGVHCAACHGRDAAGQAMLFPDLGDDHWQWGGSADAIEQSIRMGRTAVMPPLIAALGEDGVTELANYVVALGEGRGDEPEHESARTRYASLCIACHGADATGNALLGAPDLTSGAYVYGGDYDSIYTTIAEGRTGQMPSFGDRLDATQIRLLTAWLIAGQ